MPIAHIIGLGKSGIAAARLLKREGWEVTLSDRSSSPNLLAQQQELAREGIAVELGKSFAPVESIELIVVSPGVSWDIPALKQARELGIETIGEMELAWRYLKSPWVGITGTNGKTTTTALIAAIFAEAGLYAPAGGNIGYAVCELALAEKQPDWVIAEISSYQIESSPSVAPRIGIWTTFTPDHLSRHKTLENYYAIKAALLHRSAIQVLNGDDPYLRAHAADTWPTAHWTSTQGKPAIAPLQPTTWLENGWVTFKGQAIVKADALRMVGQHNLQNLLMAVTAACLAEIEPAMIAEAIADFPGVPHRLEHVLTWRGVDFINDSKATNYDAAEVGLEAVTAPVVLIAGGEPKTGNDEAWLRAIHAKAIKVLLVGEAADSFAQRLDEVDYSQHEVVKTLERAVLRGAELAAEYRARSVLLSPACASFDQYKSFEHRGDHFRQLCQEYLKLS
ncbi:MAG: UDP-N-acetylmuramoyl-L-alanine--D-glutamate ligase [Leptolyngbyaceae cyanobacterium SM1_1_3]|nr:UDP-N-acetylmuramoyl-L-alanine--D-glutamate ligase [Leptolyngbyaceae cyanobacterium SM1_1_3]